MLKSNVFPFLADIIYAPEVSFLLGGTGMSRRKKLWIGIFAAFTAGIVVLNPAMAYASEVDEVIVFGSGSSATEYAEENLDYEGEYEIDE